MPGSGGDNDDDDDGGGGGGLPDNLWQDWQAKHFHGDIALVVMDMVVDVDLLTIFSRTGRPSIVMGEDQPPFIWDHVNAANASHLNIGNMMMMDQVLSVVGQFGTGQFGTRTIRHQDNLALDNLAPGQFGTNIIKKDNLAPDNLAPT